MTRRRSADASAIVETTQSAVANADVGRGHDGLAPFYLEWLRQVERIEATSLAGFATLLQTVATRAASARTWAEWGELAGTGFQEAMDDVARAQGEWLSALMQCQMEAVKLLLDMGRPAMQASPGSDADLAAAWFSPWMIGAGLRPVQIA